MANRIHDAFDSIKAQSQLTESTKQFISQKYRKKTWMLHRPAFQRTLVVVCMVFVLAMGMGGYSWLQTPVSYLSIDVNPSIELALNRLNRVVSMAAYNVEGEEILKSLSLRGKKYTDAIDLIVESKVMNTYLTDDSELVFTVAAAGSRENELKSGVENCSNHIGHNSYSVSADIGIVPQAHDHGLSLGKYYAYLQLTQYDDTVTVDECRDMSMSEIHGLISEHEQGGEHHQNAEHRYLDESSVGESSVDESSVSESSIDDHSKASHQSGHHQEGHHE